MITDAHTHRPDAVDAVINIAPGERMRPDAFYSVGIHPWRADEPFDEDVLAAAAADPRVVAIGETGLDSLCAVPLERQEQVLRLHIALSEALGKPLILHVVRRWDDILRLRRELRPTQPWIVHGFRGKPRLARQLVDAGLLLSIGEHFNAASIAAVPQEALLVETDESALPVADIAARAGLPLRDLSPIFTTNYTNYTNL